MKDKSIEILEEKKCSGCSACLAICPTNAIKMQSNSEGFLYPKINEKDCTNCGLCSKICPELKENIETNNEIPEECYSIQAKDDIRMNGASGGMFALMANYILDIGGYVVGAAYNKKWQVEHIIINNKKDLYKLRYSKYVQSNKNNTFIEIKTLLDQGKTVLFSGCPCEVSGLKNFLMKDYDNLITIDLLCEGVGSPKIWELYLNNNYDINNIKEIVFRDKEFFSEFNTNLCLSIYFNDGTVDKRLWYNSQYFFTFINAIQMRKRCYTCPYVYFPRVGDITIGDFWGVELLNSSIDNRGTSILFINNKKIKNILEKIENDYALFHRFKIQDVMNMYNDPNNYYGNAIQKNIPEHQNRKDLFKNIDKFGLDKTMKYVIDDYADVGILNLCAVPNYGAILTSYAVYNAVQKLGYLPKIISYLPEYLDINQHFQKKFYKRHFNLSKPYRSKIELEELNDKIDTFIVGSDQIWNYGAEWFWNHNGYEYLEYKNIFYLSFANLEKNLIAFAASFGHNVFFGNYKNQLLTKYNLNRFDHISLREKDGVDMCKDIFDIDAEHLIEPVFLLDKEDWDNILLDSEINSNECKGKLAYYFLDPNEEKYEALNYISKKLNLEILDACNSKEIAINGVLDSNYGFQNEVEDFLFIIKHSDFVVTDSFHGTCFSSIFKKEFISFFNKDRGASRFSVFQTIGLSNRIINGIDDIKNNDKLFEPINYNIMDEVVKKEKEKSMLWLKNAIENKKDKKITSENNIIEYLLKENDRLDRSILDLKNKANDLYYRTDDLYNRTNNLYYITNEHLKKIDTLSANNNWIKLFGIYNTDKYLYIVFFGIRLTLKINSNNINK
ncbi:polysaccharide pyruvyl transferase family protein, partial [Brachyspira pulli]|uniref:polysaccharide pyruvyl transferase family protein n=1 Tax=Brachyspira pulli TaxID=310721 RepID=UPI003003E620